MSFDKHMRNLCNHNLNLQDSWFSLHLEQAVFFTGKAQRGGPVLFKTWLSWNPTITLYSERLTPAHVEMRATDDMGLRGIVSATAAQSRAYAHTAELFSLV